MTAENITRAVLAGPAVPGAIITDARLRALTVRQPYCSATAAGVKRTENRAGGITTYRGDVALHAGHAWSVDGLTGSEQDLSRRCGWMLDTGTDPRTVPALIVYSGMPGWWFLDHDGTGCARYGWPGEIPTWMWQGTLAEATAALGVTPCPR